MTIDLPDLEATRQFGLRLAERLFPAAVVALIGELGSGKTTLSRAIAEGLGVADGRVVTSPRRASSARICIMRTAPAVVPMRSATSSALSPSNRRSSSTR